MLDSTKQKEILSKKNVVGFSGDLQVRIKDGKKVEGTNVLRVYVTKKENKIKLLLSGDSIPQKINGLETDIVEIGELKSLLMPPDQRKSLNSAMIGGISIGHQDITAGTFARAVWLNKRPYFLSNNHVVANSALDTGGGGKIGDKIYQPGPYDITNSLQDSLQEKYYIGDLAEIKYLSISNINTVDAALVRPKVAADSRGWFNQSQLFLDTITDTLKTITPIVGMSVTKSGRTTGITNGTIIDVNATVNIPGYSGKTITFEKQIMIQPEQAPFVSGGDSGSLLMFKENNIGTGMVGLIFAGSDTIGVANRMDEVEKAFSAPLTFDGPFFWEVGKEFIPAGDENLPEYVYTSAFLDIPIEVIKKVEIRDVILSVSPLNTVYAGDVFPVTGSLLDAISGLPLSGKNIMVDQIQTQTNQNGIFSIMHPAFDVVGNYNVHITFQG